MMHPAKVLEGSVVSVDSFGYHNRSPLDNRVFLRRFLIFLKLPRESL